MRILVIGDIHGHDSWKAIVENEKYDKVVFLGDYVDSFTLQPLTIVKNLREILKFKRENKDKVVLLWGNHDHSYFFGERYYNVNCEFHDYTPVPFTEIEHYFMSLNDK